MSQRPPFPARLDFSTGSASGKNGAGKSVAGKKTVTTAVGQGVIGQKPRQPALPAMSSGHGMDSAAVRARMVRNLAASGIGSAAVLQALGTVERHRFVDTALVNQAYEDTSLPIGLGQTISKPNVVARMCELLLGAELARAGPLARVLEIGTGCGYQAAVLSLLTREVYSIERLRGLHDKARDNLRPFRLPNVHLLFGDGMLGYAKGAPYAGIIAAAGGEAVPQAWIDQLATGGRIIAPTQMPGGGQALVVLQKTTHELKQTVLEAVHFVPLKSGIA
ncbi:MAG: protein-L-isoaspartate O-methyltransferase [Rhodoferax sp.]|nr:protein-L-isoaspartate O-methyltransferase [Rhodoferax sp.]